MDRVYECAVAEACQGTERNATSIDSIASLVLCSTGYDNETVQCNRCAALWTSTPEGACEECPTSKALVIFQV